MNGIDDYRFWRHVGQGQNPDDCWEWLGTKGEYGHGYFSNHGKSMPAHRAMWITEFGPIPDGMHVCHRCDHGWCVNPAHLFLGTPQDNMADMVAKGRQAKGVMKANAKLTDEKVRQMRTLAALGLSNREIARRYKVSEPTASNVVRRRTWRHVEDDHRYGGAMSVHPV